MLFLALGSFLGSKKVTFMSSKIQELLHVCSYNNNNNNKSNTKSYIPANELGFVFHLIRSTLLETAAPVC